MTFYIVDASIVAEYILTGPYTSYTRAFFRGALRGDLFTTPEWCLTECTNVIWKAVRFRGMPASDAEWALKNLKALPLKRAATKSILSTALAIGLKHHLAIYDSVYIALALRTQHTFITIDTKQAAVATAEGVILKSITDFK